MQDLKLTIDENGRFDLSIESGDLAGEAGLDTAIWVSLFTDARASADLITKPENRRGWAGNLANTIEGRQLGGLLWLVDQRRLTQKTVNDVVDYSKKSLQWFIDDGLLNKVEASAEIIPQSGITLAIKVTALGGSVRTQYFNLWELTGNAN